MAENFNTTPEETMLDCIYESIEASAGIDWQPSLYGVTEERPQPRLYVEDPDGNCWEIFAKPHPHHGEQT